MIRLLQQSLSPLFVAELPSVFAQEFDNSTEFLHALTKVVGPLFIHLDEIGKAFEDKEIDEYQSRDAFKSFSKIVLSGWLELSQVFFVLTGRASFFGFGLTSSRHIYKRLKLNLIRPEAIQTIMQNTLKGDQTIQKYYGMSDQECEEIAKSLSVSTNGHPRTLLDAFMTADDKEQLKSFVAKHTVDWEELEATLFRNKEHIKSLIETEGPIDLTTTVEAMTKDQQYKVVTLEIIANESFISWEGTITAAKLYIRPSVRDYLHLFLYPEPVA